MEKKTICWLRDWQLSKSFFLLKSLLILLLFRFSIFNKLLKKIWKTRPVNEWEIELLFSISFTIFDSYISTKPSLVKGSSSKKQTSKHLMQHLKPLYNDFDMMHSDHMGQNRDNGTSEIYTDASNSNQEEQLYTH